MLKEQGKVKEPTITKINRCLFICICEWKKNLVAMGAIKRKTASDFTGAKSGESERANDFEWELGYMYTHPDQRGKGHATRIVDYLLNKHGNESLMATTEIADNNPMKHLLLKNGFCMYGKSWKSTIHGGELGLFLRYKK